MPLGCVIVCDTLPCETNQGQLIRTKDTAFLRMGPALPQQRQRSVSKPPEKGPTGTKHALTFPQTGASQDIGERAGALQIHLSSQSSTRHMEATRDRTAEMVTEANRGGES